MKNKNTNQEIEIIEGESNWEQNFNDSIVPEVETTGKIDWKKYQYVRNRLSPSGRALDLSETKLLFISTAGAYLKDSQEPFDKDNVLGDYTLRRIPIDTSFEDLSISHDHYDHKYINADLQVLLPKGHLQDMVSEGKLGSVAPDWISISGYQPNIIEVKRNLAKKIIKIAKELEVQAALLVPA